MAPYVRAVSVAGMTREENQMRTHETQDMAPKPLLHLADCGAHSI